MIEIVCHAIRVLVKPDDEIQRNFKAKKKKDPLIYTLSFCMTVKISEIRTQFAIISFLIRLP